MSVKQVLNKDKKRESTGLIETHKSYDKKRILGLDIIRVIAILGVFITHSIAYKKVMEIDILSLKWTFYMILRFLAMSSVPLFLLLTGYLNNKKEISAKYYKGIIPILISYIAISFAEYIATGIYLNTPLDWKEGIVSILSFTANGYAWYFEMYIGLFLLIPFLNILYDSLSSKKEKNILILSLIFLTFLPSIIKSFKYGGVWLNTMPDYWQIIYPITYFYIGKMIKEFKPKLHVLKRIGLFILALSIPCVFCYIYSTQTEYAWYMFNGFEALTNAFIAVSIFLLFYQIDKTIPVLGKIISEISICSFEMYLFSSIWDKFLYTKCSYNLILMLFLVLITTYTSSKLFIFFRDFILKKIKFY